MAKLVYSAIMSVDGYIADAGGNFDWGAPDDDVHAAVNDVMRSVGTQLYGRRLYQVMLAWETLETDDETAVVKDFAAIWRDSDKVVYSRTLDTVSSQRTRIERDFDASTVASMKATASRDLLIGGPEIASHAFRAGLVDEVHLFVAPVSVGGGTPALPTDMRLDFTLVGERRFAGGFVHLAYGPV